MLAGSMAGSMAPTYVYRVDTVGHVDVSFRSLLLVCVSCLRVIREHERR